MGSLYHLNQEKRNTTKKILAFSLDNLKLDDDVLNIPLFMADEANRLIGLALENQKISF